MVIRRNVLKLISGGVVLAAGSAGGFVALNGPSQAARAPWRTAGQYRDIRRRALSYALLAPNPHNRQPWLVRLDGEDALTLYCDLARRLPATDPFDRQITIGCGAFLELLAQAAAQEGYQTVISTFPAGEDMKTLDARPVAHVVFARGRAVPDPLFAQVLNRRSNKEVYEPRDVGADSLAEIANAGRVFGVAAATTGNTNLAGRLRDLTWHAHFREVTTPAANQESVELMRIGAAEVAANPDGIELEGPMIEAGRLVGAVTREALADPNSTAFRQGLDLYRNMAMSARAFGWLINDNGSRLDQINAGRAYVRLNLKATALGLGIHPWSQSLQEYSEMEDLFREVHDLVGQGRRLQMLFRIGYGPQIGPTPRRGLEAHIV
ncbi:MAG: twin-arginine translocation pathway signal protein [Alphaproteobacteria bacterium]|nr:twin-arginine translocation pathway signal protein [Alphaproteobacteria bacterium]